MKNFLLEWCPIFESMLFRPCPAPPGGIFKKEGLPILILFEQSEKAIILEHISSWSKLCEKFKLPKTHLDLACGQHFRVKSVNKA